MLSDIGNGDIIYNDSDAYGNIHVINYPHYRALSFDSIYEQSGLNLEKPYMLVHEYTRIMMLVLGYCDPQHVTLLGLGGGSLLRSLHHYLTDCEFHAIELRPKIYEIAKKYFHIPEDERVLVTIEDAEEHLYARKDASTDIIFSDMYDAYYMNPLQGKKQFVKECCRTLSDNGWLVINYHNPPNVNTPFFKSLSDHFSTIKICTGEFGNHIILACKSPILFHSHVPIKIKIMEETLSDSFMPLLLRLRRAAT